LFAKAALCTGAIDARHLAATVERAVTEHTLDHVRFGLQRTELEQLEQARLAVPAVDLELAIIVLARIIIIE
jgi:hypothetical protein